METENRNEDAKFPSKPSLIVLGIFFVLWLLLALFGKVLLILKTQKQIIKLFEFLAIYNGDSSKIFPSGHANSTSEFFDSSR